MRKTPILLVTLGAVAAAAALAVWARDRGEWTTDSEAAVAELEAATRDLNRFYHREAVEHLERAAELDPDFLMPKLLLVPHLRGMDNERVKALVEELRASDLDRVTARERLLVETMLASIDRRPDRAQQLVADYLERHPADPWAVSMRCDLLWSRRDWETAEQCYRRLIEIEPNWVEAQNRLGYIAMAQGRFAEAEEQFEIYRFVAPDQPNPHDSLGELLLLIGRWGEARQELEQAIAIKPDFCPSWGNLVQLSLLEGDFESAAETLQRARRADGCPSEELDKVACRLEVWRPYAGGDWAGAVAAWAGEECRRYGGETTVLAYRAALAGGDQAVVAEIEQRSAELAETYRHEDPAAGAMIAHLRGVRLLHSGDAAAAVERFREADAALAYWGGGQAYFKLVNRLALERALGAAGRAAEAEALRAEIRRTNPPLAERWRTLEAAAR